MKFFRNGEMFRNKVSRILARAGAPRFRKLELIQNFPKKLDCKKIAIWNWGSPVFERGRREKKLSTLGHLQMYKRGIEFSIWIPHSTKSPG